jgi:hypothetical protein
MDVQGITVRFPAGARDLSLLQTVQTGCEANPLGTGHSFRDAGGSGRDFKHSLISSAEMRVHCVQADSYPLPGMARARIFQLVLKILELHAICCVS